MHSSKPHDRSILVASHAIALHAVALYASYECKAPLLGLNTFCILS